MVNFFIPAFSLQKGQGFLFIMVTRSRFEGVYIKKLFIRFRLGEPASHRAEWIFFFEKRVLFEWFRDR